jgi:hypothetical protein
MPVGSRASARRVAAVGTDQGCGFARRMHSKSTNLGEDVGGRRGAVFLHGGFYDGHQLALERPVMLFGPFP